MSANISIVIVAGGMGTRMGAAIPKQFLCIQDIPIFIHTIRGCHRAFPQAQIILVLPADHIATAKRLLTAHESNIPIEICAGGTTRFHSVSAGLTLVDGAITMVHDAVRPYIPVSMLQNLYQAAQVYGNAIPYIDVVESLRWVVNHMSKPINRDKIKIIQTPQAFQTDIIKSAYNTPYSDAFTDDASVIEQAGHTIHLVPGHRNNIKITTPEDMAYFQYIIQSS